MQKKDFRQDIEGYEEIKKEIEICRKYGIDYTARRGQTAQVVERLHPRRLNLKVVDIIDESPFARTLRLVAEDGYLPPFQAGQYINLGVQIGGVRTSRPYSISSSPRQTAYYDITVRRVENGFVSNYLLDEVKIGQRLQSGGPAGNFYYNPLFHGQRLLFLAGGSGITPFMSMIREVLDAGLERELYLIYGCRNQDDVLFGAELEKLSRRYDNFRYSLVLSDPPQGYSGRSGLITAELIQELTAGWEVDTYYLCGPAAMYDFVIPELAKMGIPRRKIRTEMFSASANISSEPGWPQEISPQAEFNVQLKDGRSLKARAGEPLLNALERNGLVVPSSCRSGECSRCRVKLLSGEVFQPRGVLLRESDRKYGYIHSCQAYPLQDLHILL